MELLFYSHVDNMNEDVVVPVTNRTVSTGLDQNPYNKNAVLDSQLDLPPSLPSSIF